MSARAVAIMLFVVAAPRIALAHGSIQGMGSFYGGMLHPFLVPAHVLVLFSLGLFLGQQAIVDLPVGFPAFMGGLATGLLIAAAGIVSLPSPVVLALAATLGVLVAAAFALPPALCAALTIGVGLAVGVDSPSDALTVGGRAAALIGTGLSAILGVFYAATLVERLRRGWQRILVRVLGSWICASASLILALALAGKR
jgi:urease accessory protein